MRLFKFSILNLLLLLVIFCISIAWWVERSELKHELGTTISAITARVETIELEVDHFDRLESAGVSLEGAAEDARIRLSIARNELATVQSWAKRLGH